MTPSQRSRRTGVTSNRGSQITRTSQKSKDETDEDWEPVPIEVSYFQMLRYDWTPRFCLTKYQRAIHRIFKKAEYRLHRELDLASILKKVRETHNLTTSFFNAERFTDALL